MMLSRFKGLKKTTACLLMLGLLLAPASVLAYGGGGGGGGGDVGGNSRNIDPWSSNELATIFSSVTPEQKSNLVDAFTGTTITKRDLLTVRQVFLEKNSSDANRDADILDAMVKTLEILDKTGEYTQEVLSFVPGVGWVTAASLGAARGGANAYRDGKSAGEITRAVFINGSASALVGKFSPMNSDTAFNTARAGVNIARNTLSTEVRKRAMKVAAKALGRFGGKKAAEYGAEKGVGAMMEAAADAVSAKNHASVPSYTPTPGFDPMSSAPSTPVAGGTVQF